MSQYAYLQYMEKIGDKHIDSEQLVNIVRLIVANEDVVESEICLTHGDLLHSGTPNISGEIRYFLSVFYNLTWFKHTDTHQGPLTQRLVEEARARKDHRLMRLLGVDEQLRARWESGLRASLENASRILSQYSVQIFFAFARLTRSSAGGARLPADPY